jgi:hypothetical protein
MPSTYRQIVLTHWNAGVFRPAALPQLLPELIIYALLYDEVLIREEDLITNRAITRLLASDDNLRIFSELLAGGFVKLLRLPLDSYPAGRRFDPIRLPISARVEEHQVRRSYKGNPWKPTAWEWRLFASLDEIIAKHPSASRYHLPFASDNPFAAQLGEILQNREEYRLPSHPVFRYLNARTADTFVSFCQDPDAWRRFLHHKGVDNPIVGPDAGFYRSAAYQCSNFLPTRRAIRRLVESVYAATYCERESSDGRYGGSELVELPYRYSSDRERETATSEAQRIELAPTDVAAQVSLRPGIATVLARTRMTPEFQLLRRTLDALGADPESPLLAESRFREAWRNVCAIYAENAAIHQLPLSTADKRVTHYFIYAYILARVLGLVIMPSVSPFELQVAGDAAAIAVMEKWGPAMAKGFRALVNIPALREHMEAAVDVRCSPVPLTIERPSRDGGA